MNPSGLTSWLPRFTDDARYQRTRPVFEGLSDGRYAKGRGHFFSTRKSSGYFLDSFGCLDLEYLIVRLENSLKVLGRRDPSTVQCRCIPRLALLKSNPLENPGVPCGKEVSARTLLQGARLRASINQKKLCKNLSSRSVATARARASAPLRPASGASEDNLSGCHRPARPFRRAP